MDKQFAKAGQGGYGRNRETFARAFECYMVDKLWEEGNENQYLTVFSGRKICCERAEDRGMRFLRETSGNGLMRDLAR